MSRAYSIWHKVTACNYQSDKSYGNKATSEETVFVGSSASNSHEHARITTTKRNYVHDKHGEVIRFATSIDGVIIKESFFKINKKGLAGEFIETVNRIQKAVNV